MRDSSKQKPGVHWRVPRLTESFLDALNVIVVPTTGLTTFQQAVQHRFLVRCEKEHH